MLTMPGMGGGVFVTVVILFYARNVETESVFDKGYPDECIKGLYQLDAPVPQSGDPFPECTDYRKSSCCDRNTTLWISEGRGHTALNDMFDKCGELSENCKKFMKQQECFYRCEPMVGYFERTDVPGQLNRVPLCGSVGDAWYEACKEDQFCADDLVFEIILAGNKCPEDSECKKVKERYSSGKDMLDKIFGMTYGYVESDKECMVFDFDPEEDSNLKGNYYSSMSVFNKGYPNHCIKGWYHLDAPAPQTGDPYPACTDYKKASCCDRNTTQLISESRGHVALNEMFDKCGDISDGCLKFMRQQECFYRCEPMLGYFERADVPGQLNRVPLCGSVADAWYEACKNEKTCADDLVFDAILADQKCPQDSTCKTIKERYGSAKDMVETIFGRAYKYISSDEDCMVFDFDPEKMSNLKGDFYTSGAAPFLFSFYTLILVFLFV